MAGLPRATVPMHPTLPQRLRLASFLAFLVLAGLMPAAAQVTVAVGADPSAIAVNARTNRVYVANEGSDSVTVIDGNTNSTSTIAVGPRPQFIAVNAATNRIYVNNAGDSSISVIDGTTRAVTHLPLGSVGPLLVDEARNRVFVLRAGHTDEVTLIDGATNTWYSIAIFSYGPVAQALDGPRQRLYVANHETGDVRIVDLTSTSIYPPSTSVGVWSRPVDVAFDAEANRAFVVTQDARGPINIIEGGAGPAAYLAPPGRGVGGRAVAVDPRSHKAFAVFEHEVIVVDGATRAMAFVPAWTGVDVAVNPFNAKAYVPSAEGAMAIIDIATHAASHVSIPRGAKAVAVNPATGRVYVLGEGVTVLEAHGAPPPAPPPPAPTAAPNVQGLWWAAPAGVESGWGVNLAHQGEMVFATWFTYDADGTGLWLAMPEGRRTGGRSFAGDLYRTTGPAFNAVPFDPARVQRTWVGTASFEFTDGDNGRMRATLNGASVDKAITRQVFAAPAPACAAGGAPGAMPNYQDLWWAAPAGSESGWGMNVTHQGDILFVTWFTYGPDGKAIWLVGPNVAKTGNGTYAGALYRTTGPPFDASPWNPAQVAAAEMGSLRLSFSDASHGVMSYTLAGISQTKPITRQVFAEPATVCR
jgi:YVTN family beta-propeller protein